MSNISSSSNGFSCIKYSMLKARVSLFSCLFAILVVNYDIRKCIQSFAVIVFAVLVVDP